MYGLPFFLQFEVHYFQYEVELKEVLSGLRCIASIGLQFRHHNTHYSYRLFFGVSEAYGVETGALSCRFIEKHQR